MNPTEIIIAYIKSHPELEARVRQLCDQTYKAPELIERDIDNHVGSSLYRGVVSKSRDRTVRAYADIEAIEWRVIAKTFSKAEAPPSVDLLSVSWADIKLSPLQREAFEDLVGAYYDQADQRSRSGDALFFWIRDNIPMKRKFER